jgi:phenylacetate-CoA ligase
MYLEDVETLDRTALHGLQSARLGALVERLKASRAPYWREKLAGVGGITSIDELESLPFTGKQEFRDTYPYGMLSVPLDRVVRIHASSGTSGKPTIVAYSAHDIAVFAEVNARALSAAGATNEDIVHVAYGYGAPNVPEHGWCSSAGTEPSTTSRQKRR